MKTANVVKVVLGCWVLGAVAAVAGAARDGVQPMAPAPQGVKLPREEPEGTKAAVITIGGEGGDIVGLHVDRAWVKEMAARLKEELGEDRRGVLVVRVRSAGGLMREAREIARAVRGEFLPWWRTVCWVESAGGAAVLAVYSIEETVFTPAGWMTVGGGNGEVEPERPEKALKADERLSEWGGRDPRLLRAMRVQAPVSATVKKDGTVRFFSDETSGKVLVNPKGNVLVMDAGLAEKVKFSAGTTDSLEELGRLLGYKKVN
jgi:hypothetical protein